MPCSARRRSSSSEEDDRVTIDAVVLAALSEIEAYQRIRCDVEVPSTVSGHTARLIAKYRPWAPVLAVCPVPEVCRQLAVTWGVRSVAGFPVPEQHLAMRNGNAASADIPVKESLAAVG